eukprot:scaffold10309_cov90-Alexandrium_tamarense.AAC.1
MTYCFYCFAQRGWTATRRSGKSGASPGSVFLPAQSCWRQPPPKDLLPPLPTDTHQFLFCEGMCSVVAKLQHSHLKEPLLALSRGCGPFLPRVVEGDVGRLKEHIMLA